MPTYTPGTGYTATSVLTSTNLKELVSNMTIAGLTQSQVLSGTVSFVQISASDPGTTTDGSTWYDTTTDILKIYNGSAWASVGDFPAFNVKAYGAVGDGTTNDAGSIGDAIADLVSAGRGILHFPPGVYGVSSAPVIEEVDDFMILGAGQGASVLKILDSSDINYGLHVGVDDDSTTIADHVTIQGMSFDGNESNNSAAAPEGVLKVFNAKQLSIIDCSFSEGESAGLFIDTRINGSDETLTQYVMIVNSSFRFNNNFGIRHIGCKHCVISNCIVNNNNGVGGTLGIGISLEAMGADQGGFNSVINGCSIDGNGDAAACIDGPGISIDGVSRLVVSNNYIGLNGGPGIRFLDTQSVTDSCSDVSIVNNMFYQNAARAGQEVIGVSAGTGVFGEGVTISNNQIVGGFGLNTSDAKYGIDITGMGSGVISNNTIRLVEGTGIKLSTISDCNILNNVIIDNGDASADENNGIHILGTCARLSVYGNRLNNNETSGSFYELNIVGTLSFCRFGGFILNAASAGNEYAFASAGELNGNVFSDDNIIGTGVGNQTVIPAADTTVTIPPFGNYIRISGSDTITTINGVRWHGREIQIRPHTSSGQLTFNTGGNLTLPSLVQLDEAFDEGVKLVWDDVASTWFFMLSMASS